VSLLIQHSDFFWANLTKQVDWYRENAGPEVAERFVDAVEMTLSKLANTPDMGRRRFREWPELEGMRSFRVQRPFHRLIVFYRTDSTILFAERLIHGARDLPRRLRKPPVKPSS